MAVFISKRRLPAASALGGNVFGGGVSRSWDVLVARRRTPPAREGSRRDRSCLITFRKINEWQLSCEAGPSSRPAEYLNFRLGSLRSALKPFHGMKA